MEKRKSQGKGPKQGLSSERLEACFQFLCSLAISPCGLSLVPFVFFFLVFLFIFNLMGLVFLALRHFWALWSFLNKKKKKCCFSFFGKRGLSGFYYLRYIIVKYCVLLYFAEIESSNGERRKRFLSAPPNSTKIFTQI
jgi:hypothetical protein